MSRGKWTEENEKLAIAISNKHAALVWICNRSAERAEKRQKIINIITAIGLYILGGSGIPSVLTYTTDESSDSETNRAILITISVLTIMFGLLKTVNIMMQDDQIIGKNRWASGIHAELVIYIRKEIERPESSREKWHKFYERVGEKEIKLQSDEPRASKYVLKAYCKQFGTDSIRESILFGTMFDIKNADNITIHNTFDVDKAYKNQHFRKHRLRAAITSAELSLPVSKHSGSVSSEKKNESSGSSSYVQSTQTPPPTPAPATSSTEEHIQPPTPAPATSSTEEHIEPPARSRTRAHKREPSAEPVDEEKIIANLAIRRDMRDRYELERYFMH